MKKPYENPNAEILRFYTEDVLTTSPDNISVGDLKDELVQKWIY